MIMLHNYQSAKSPQTSEPRGTHIMRTPATADELTDALANTERMASILRALLEKRLSITARVAASPSPGRVHRHGILWIFIITFGSLAATNSRCIKSRPEVDMGSADAAL